MVMWLLIHARIKFMLKEAPGRMWAARVASLATGTQRTFQRLISNDIAHKEMVFKSLVIHHLIMITCISFEIVFTVSLPKLINIAPLKHM